MSSTEMVGPGKDDTAAAVIISTERLRQRLQQEGLSEEAIADSERIVRAEFEALQKQALPLGTPQDLGNLRVTQEAMEASFTFQTSLNEWRNYLCDINFWIYVQELPRLKHLHVDDPILTAPAWEELHVRGCSSLRRLPRFSRRQQQPDKKKKKAVKVSGERAWWAKLRWDEQDQVDDDDALLHRDGYEPMLPPVFASHRERVVIKSYLR